MNNMNDDLINYYIPKSNKLNAYRKITTYKSKDCELYNYHDKAIISLNKYLHHSDFAKAYIKGRSIITNAKAHKYNDVFICLDIKDFFSSIRLEKLSNILFYEINKKRINRFTKKQCDELVNSCTNSNVGLAIGLKPSPILANIYLKEFDGLLYGKLKRIDVKNIIYTRYADDITISYKQCLSKAQKDLVNDEIVNIVENLLRKYSLKLNRKKTRIIDLDVSNHVRITGINITKDEKDFRKLTVGRKTKNEIYNKAIALLSNNNHDDIWRLEVQKLKGLQSFVLSVEGISYQKSYSDRMISIIKEHGYDSLKEYIDSL